MFTIMNVNDNVLLRQTHEEHRAHVKKMALPCPSDSVNQNGLSFAKSLTMERFHSFHKGEENGGPIEEEKFVQREAILSVWEKHNVGNCEPPGNVFGIPIDVVSEVRYATHSCSMVFPVSQVEIADERMRIPNLSF